MLLDYSKVDKLFIVCGRSDLRKGIDGLARIIQHDYDMNVYENAIFLFCGTRADRFKLLYWDGDGFFSATNELRMGVWNGQEKKKRYENSHSNKSAGY